MGPLSTFYSVVPDWQSELQMELLILLARDRRLQQENAPRMERVIKQEESHIEELLIQDFHHPRLERVCEIDLEEVLTPVS